MFTSDNGPEAEVPPHGRTPFRGAKGSTWEGGVRVPTFVYWKGMIQPRKSDGIVDLADLFPTALDLAGHHGAKVANLVPKTTFIDGVDQTSFFTGTNGQSNRKAEHYFLNGKLSAVRMDEFKYHVLIQQPYAYTQSGYQGGFTGTVMQTADRRCLTCTPIRRKATLSACAISQWVYRYRPKCMRIWRS